MSEEMAGYFVLGMLFLLVLVMAGPVIISDCRRRRRKDQAKNTPETHP